MPKKLLLVVVIHLVLSVGLAWGQICEPNNKSTVFYANGVLTTKGMAEDSLYKSLKPKMQARLQDCLYESCVDFKLAYNLTRRDFVSTYFLEDFYEFIAQRENEVTTKFLSWLSGIEFLPDDLQQYFLDELQTINGLTASDRENLQQQIDSYADLLGRKENVVVVAHSQGNYFANEAYSFLFEGILRLPEDKFHIVAVATPASLVKGEGPWTTLERDFISHLPFPFFNPLPANIDNGPCGGFVDCHAFDSSYLAGSNSGSKIINDVLDAIYHDECSLNAYWPTYQHDAQHSGQSPDIGPQTSDSRLVYDLARTDGVYNSAPNPVVGPTGLIYFTFEAPANSYQWKLLAVNSDGSIAFEKGPYSGRAHVTPVVAEDGTLFVGTISGTGPGDSNDLYCFYPDGRLKWIRTGLGVWEELTLGIDGMVYVGSMGAYQNGPTQILCLNPDDGTDKWPPYTLNATSVNVPAVSLNGNIIVTGRVNYTAFVSAHDATNGASLWSVGYPIINSRSGVVSPPAVAPDGTIYFWASPRLWSVSADGQTILSSPVIADTLGSTPAIAPDGSVRLAVAVNVNLSTARVYAFSKSLEFQWSTDLESNSCVWYTVPQVAVDSQGTAFVSLNVNGGCALEVPLIFSVDNSGSIRWNSPGVFANTIILNGPNKAYTAIFDGISPFWSWKIYSFEPVPF